jgi:hypothetical protein
MSTIQVANINFETTANNQFVYTGANTIVVRTGGANVMTISNTVLSFGGTFTYASANAQAQSLTDGATINWDTSLGQIATVTLGGNRTLANPTNTKIGTYILNVIQDGTGSRTLSWSSNFKWSGGVAPVLTTAAGSRDMFSFFSDGTYMYGSFIPDIR